MAVAIGLVGHGMLFGLVVAGSTVGLAGHGTICYVTRAILASSPTPPWALRATVRHVNCAIWSHGWLRLSQLRAFDLIVGSPDVLMAASLTRYAV